MRHYILSIYFIIYIENYIMTEGKMEIEIKVEKVEE